MLYLYHASPSVAPVLVRIVLQEKGLPWDGKILDLLRGDQFQPEYRKLNPKAVVPTLVHDGRTISESRVIIEYLEEAFPSPALMPADPYDRAIARLWMKKIDDYLHDAVAVLSFAIAFRRKLLKKTPEQVEARFAAIPDPIMREHQRLAALQGFEAPHVATALQNYDKYVGEMEEALVRSPFLAGNNYSLADAVATAYINRAAMLAMDCLWIDRRPSVVDWFERIRHRPSFQDAITKYLSDVDREVFNIPREETSQKIREILTSARAVQAA